MLSKIIDVSKTTKTFRGALASLQLLYFASSVKLTLPFEIRRAEGLMRDAQASVHGSIMESSVSVNNGNHVGTMAWGCWACVFVSPCFSEGTGSYTYVRTHV